MKIGVVAPCPVPYTVGGAEKLWWGFVSHLNERTGHQADIIKLPSPEGDLRSLIASYQQFSILDLSGFDVVISGKYPAWMVSHPRHVCYMLHRLRGLYDAYPGEVTLPYDVAADPQVGALYGFMRRCGTSRSALPEFFDRARELLARAEELPGLLDFPGPFARDIVHWLDDAALAPGAIERYAAISHTVAQRAEYFPSDVEVHVAWPPPHTPRAPSLTGSYLFTVSRFDAPKRIGLIIEAMRHVKGNVPLLIAGTGPEEARLRALAGDDARIRFLGFQNDEEIAGHYMGACAVPFVPYQEDYGLITVEAMQAGKAVVTTRDAGGPCELVVDGETGFVCDPEPAAIGAALERLVANPELAIRLGEAAHARAATITWEEVVAKVVPSAHTIVSAPRIRGNVKKLVVATTFGIFPARHGGQSRVYNLYRNLAPEYETTIVSFTEPEAAPMDREIAPGVREIRVPKSDRHQEREAIVSSELGVPVTDVLMPQLWNLTPAYDLAIAAAAEGADALVACHPYLYPALVGRGVPIWYEVQDLEWKLKREVLGETSTGQQLLAAVHAIEMECANAAEVLLCAADSDAEDLVTLYGVPRERIIAAPNGTDSSRILYTGATRRNELKARMGLEDRRLALFVGSGHWPNIEAAKQVFNFAAALPEIVFVVVGSVCYAFSPAMLPRNVLCLGEVDDVTRNLSLEMCDVAINPMAHGTGTNLKMLDFFAAGIPVITTPTGARGLGVEDGGCCRIVEMDSFVPAIAEHFETDAATRDAQVRQARALVEERFDWQRIAAAVKHALEGRSLSVR